MELPVWLTEFPPRFDDKILDVGSGAGELLIYLRTLGYRHLVGVDPYLTKDLTYPNGVVVYASEIGDVQGRFDFIMFHHSFEHISDPHTVFDALPGKLVSGGSVLIRIPVVPSEAWEEYGVDWVQLDAPRHLYLYSRKSLELLARAHGFKVTRVVFDSTAAQFWGSEQYRQDIPLLDPRSHRIDPDGSIFSITDMRSFEERAVRANIMETGDQACFLLEAVV